jgi:hypothetical protein
VSVPLHAVDERLDRDELERILTVWQQRLRLDHWDIRIDWTVEPDDGHVAQIKAWDVYDYATVRFNQTPDKGISAWSRLVANRNVAHELLHLVMRDVDYVCETGELVLAASVWKVFEANFDNTMEQAVDRLASVLVDLGGVV